VNNTHYVPAQGLKAPARLVSCSAAPYPIRKCTRGAGPDGDLFTVTTSAGTASVRLPVGERVLLDRILRSIRLSGIDDLVVVESSSGALVLIDRQESGPQSFIRVSGRAATSMGFLQTGARGQFVYPPWRFGSSPDIYPTVRVQGVRQVGSRFPQFTRKVRGNPTFKVTYTAHPERCPRCLGTYVENDARFDTSGEMVVLENEDLLHQICLKAILTERGSNPFHPRYGSRVMSRIGSKIGGAAAAQVREDVLSVLQQVQTLQQSQSKYQTVRNRERLYSIDNVSVSRDPVDFTILYLDVTVRNASRTPINLTTVFTVPGAIALAGTNGQSLGSTRSPRVG